MYQSHNSSFSYLKRKNATLNISNMSLQYCPQCKEQVLTDIDPSSGATICTQCGTVLEESQIISEITFSETSTGASRVEGTLIQAESTRHFRVIPGARTESRELTLEKGFFRDLINL